MPQDKTGSDRMRELEAALKEAERRVAVMLAERDEAFELVEQMKEHVSDVDALIDTWIEAFEVRLGDDRKRTHDALPESITKILADAVALRNKARGSERSSCAVRSCRQGRYPKLLHSFRAARSPR